MTGGDGARAEKAALRAAMKERLGLLGSRSFAEAGGNVAARLAGLRSWRDARTVCAFLSMKGEIDTGAVCAAALDAEKILCLPRTEGAELSFRVCGDSTGPWDSGPFGIREPVAAAPLADFSVLPGPVLVLVPGLAFDERGGRLGRGKGYYDRFLRSLRSLRADAYAVGIALSCQLVDSVPFSELDERVDLVLTD
jgi:5-formyltetrahydrofolate cyclo-ligase